MLKKRIHVIRIQIFCVKYYKPKSPGRDGRSTLTSNEFHFIQKKIKNICSLKAYKLSMNRNESICATFKLNLQPVKYHTNLYKTYSSVKILRKYMWDLTVGNPTEKSNCRKGSNSRRENYGCNLNINLSINYTSKG